MARSHLAERLTRPAQLRGTYREPEDAVLLPMIRAIVDVRPSYGYRRVTALVNRVLRSRGEAVVNAKRVRRILRVNGLTLAPHTARRPGRTHDGTVVGFALERALVLGSPRTALPGWGDRPRVVFHRRLRPRDHGVVGDNDGRLRRDGLQPNDRLCRTPVRGTKTPHPIEWLSDNGSAYIAKQTAQTAAALRLRLLFTPVRSPQSNDISEAFVKTLKRDYARLAILPDAETVMRLLPGWFEDYNTVHPYSGLRMLSPREFLSRSA